MENGIRFDLEYETMPWHRVDAVVFDIGNILIRYAPKDFLEQLFPGDAQKQQDMLARVYNGPYWERLDRGEMEYAEAARRLAGQFGGDEAEYMRALTGWIELKTPIDEGFRAAQRCRPKAATAPPTPCPRTAGETATRCSTPYGPGCCHAPSVRCA